MSPAEPRTWQGVRSEVLRRIRTRQWKPGTAIPTETALAAEFGCARTTVNRALRELARDGILERKRKSGTRVALHPVGRAVLDIPVIRHEVGGKGLRYDYRLLSRETLGAAGAHGAAAPPAGALCGDDGLLHVRALHLADGAPHILEDRWISLRAVPEALSADFSTTSANEWLLEHIPYTRGDLAISALPCPPGDAATLGLAPGTPLLALDRITWNGPLAVTAVRLLHMPGHRLETSMAPG